VSEKLDVETIDAKEDKAVRNPEIAITYITKPIKPPQFITTQGNDAVITKDDNINATASIG
jgi:hypothetical protein